MSLFDIGVSLASSLVQGGFGGGNNVNLARSFSQREGLPCTVRDDQKNLVLSMKARGLTGQQICTAATGGIPTQTWEDVIAKKLPPVPPGGVEGIFKDVVLPGIVGAIGGPVSAVTTTGRAIIGAGARRAPGVYYTTTGRLSSVVLASGKSMGTRQIASFIRFVGDIALAASILGISMQDAADVLTRKRRRRRGISGAQLANAKRVICTVNRMAKDLNCKPTAGRRTACR